MRGAACFLVLAAFFAQAAYSANSPTNSAKKIWIVPSEPARPILQWEQVETTDYKTYVKNLRAVGCPKQTICDIVTADVSGAYAGKRAEALAARYVNYTYWRSDTQQTAARAQLSARRQVIDGEMNYVLQQLLGDDTPLPNVNDEWSQAALDMELNFLPDDARSQTEKVLMSYALVDEQVKELAASMFVSEDTNELQRILQNYEAKRAALNQILSPAEYERVEMTTSWTSENLRRAMAHFEPTEAEFRAIFQAWQPHDERLARLEAARKENSGEDDVYVKIKGELTPERYKLYCDTWWN